MNLVTLDKLNELRFAAVPVDVQKLRRWCREGALPAKKIGGTWFVDLEAFDRPAPAKPDMTDLARRVIKKLQRSA